MAGPKTNGKLTLAGPQTNGTLTLAGPKTNGTLTLAGPKTNATLTLVWWNFGGVCLMKIATLKGLTFSTPPCDLSCNPKGSSHSGSPSVPESEKLKTPCGQRLG